MASDVISGGKGKPARAHRLVATAALALLTFFLGRVFAPVLLPYKQYLSDSFIERAWLQVQALGSTWTYYEPDAIESYIALVLIFSVAYGVFHLRSRVTGAFYYFLIGTYYNVMLDGGKAAGAHAAFDRVAEPALPFLTSMPFYLMFPLVLMLVLPLMAAFVITRAQ